MSTKQTSERSSKARSMGTEQLSVMGSAATETFERVARQNYAVIGDMVDFTLATMHIPTRESDVKSVFEAQADQARSFAETARRRMQEYVDIASGFGQRLAESPAGSDRARRAVATTTRQAHEAIANAGGTPNSVARSADAAAETVAQVKRTAADTAEAATRAAADTAEAATDTAKTATANAKAANAKASNAESSSAKPSKKKAAAKRKATAKKSGS